MLAQTVLRRLLAGTVLAGLLSGSADVGAASATEVDVRDGDTFLLDGVRIRLWGIDAPELGQTCERDGTVINCGELAREVLKAVLGRENVTCQPKDSDRNGRTVAQCEVNGVDVAMMMVRSGWALDFSRYSAGYYAADEVLAKRARRGLWAGKFQLPWEWRRASPRT